MVNVGLGPTSPAIVCQMSKLKRLIFAALSMMAPTLRSLLLTPTVLTLLMIPF